MIIIDALGQGKGAETKKKNKTSTATTKKMKQSKNKVEDEETDKKKRIKDEKVEKNKATSTKKKKKKLNKEEDDKISKKQKQQEDDTRHSHRKQSTSIDKKVVSWRKREFETNRDPHIVLSHPRPHSVPKKNGLKGMHPFRNYWFLKAKVLDKNKQLELACPIIEQFPSPKSKSISSKVNSTNLYTMNGDDDDDDACKSSEHKIKLESSTISSSSSIMSWQKSAKSQLKKGWSSNQPRTQAQRKELQDALIKMFPEDNKGMHMAFLEIHPADGKARGTGEMFYGFPIMQRILKFPDNALLLILLPVKKR